MTKVVININIFVVIYKIFVACIIRRIDVDYVYLSFVGLAKGCKCLKVITLN